MTPNKQVSPAIRILRGERDVSARATHLEAATRKFLVTTNERKQMSTKTNFKRIALVAVAALGLGALSSVPAQAAPTIAYTSMYDTTNGVQAVNGIATVTLTYDGGLRHTVTSSGVGTVVGVDSPTATSGVVSVLGTPTSGSWSETNTAGGTYTRVVSLQSTTAGTQTITVTPLNSSGVPGTAVTKNVTWTATGTLAVTSATVKLMDSATTSGNLALNVSDQSFGGKAYANLVDTTVALKYAASSTVENLAMAAAKFVDGNGNAVSGASVTVTLTGPGILSASSSNNESATSTASSGVRAFTCTTGAAGTCSTFIKADASSGKSTITFKTGTVSVSTSLDFYSSSVGSAGYTITPLSAVYEAGVSASGASGVKVVVKDANGVAIAGNTPNIFTTTAAVATPGTCTASTTAGTSYCSITGVAAGTSVITIANNAVLASATVTKNSSVVVGSGVASKITVAYDKSSYSPGSAGEIVFTLTSADGKPVADGTYAIAASGGGMYFTGVHGANGTGGSTGFAPDLVSTIGASQASDLYSLSVGGYSGAGKAIYAFYAPAYATTLTGSATTMTSGNAKLAGAALGAVLAPKATVTGGDAAAALAAVTALATTVASLKTLITTLTNLVLKIQKKVKA
jgi:hypothetical protein